VLLTRVLAIAIALGLPGVAASAPPAIDGPWVTFAGQDSATVRWSTGPDVVCMLRWAEKGGEPREIRAEGAAGVFAVAVAGLKRGTEYVYSIVAESGGVRTATEEFIVDTEFDFSVPPLRPASPPFADDGPQRAAARAAEFILRASGVDRGYCIDWGCGEGRLAYELARQSSLFVVGFSSDEAAVRRGRQRLIEAGAYGARVTLRHVPSLEGLPVPDLCANLIVSGEILVGGMPAPGVEAVWRKLRPHGGRAYLGGPRGAADRGQAFADWLRGDPEVAGRLESAYAGEWAVVDRSAGLPGAGQWTHAYGDAGQATNSFDELVRGTAGETLEVQWFGLPGPNAMIDRQVRMQGPVSAAGRVVSQGNDRLIAQDAYNGTILWSMETPGLRRCNLPRNTGNVCIDATDVYVAMRGYCWRIDAATGDRRATYPVVPVREGVEYDWGYVARVGDLLLGSAVQRGSFDTGWIGPEYWYDDHEGPDTAHVCSDNLFGLRPGDGTAAWTYTGGLVVNPTIVAGEGRVCFIESRSPEALAAPGRKLETELWHEVYLVCLSATDGQTIWERPIDPLPKPIVAYAVLHDGLVGLVTSSDGAYHIRVVSVTDGTDRWATEYAWRSDNHGHHIQHPVIAEGRIYLEPYVHDWQTGQPFEVEYPTRSKCGTMTAAAHLLHYRDYNDEVWDLQTGTQSEFSRLRSNCWIGMISGNGLLMSPESAGGCSCQWPVYTSLTYRTKDDY